MTTATTERSVVEVLRAAKERISDPERLAQGVSARDREGNRCDYEEAFSFCALGTLEFESDRLYPEAVELLDEAARERHGAAVHVVNDRLGHAATMAMYDRAIELAERGQK